MPEYGSTIDNPYSDIGFPQYMNPYMQKKAMKAYWKQQKYLAKYGPGGLYSMYNQNDLTEKETRNAAKSNSIFDEFEDDEDNVLGMVHSLDYKEQATEEPEMVQEYGR